MNPNIRWTKEQLQEVGIDSKKLNSLVQTLLKCSTQLQHMGLEIYGESGTGYLIHESRPTHNEKGQADFSSIVASVGPGFNGGGW